jgi:formamidopyrimidine-DNA glycosylase
VPELPDLTVYLEHLSARLKGATLTSIRLNSPFLLRTVTPTVEDLLGREVLGVRRLAKQVVMVLTGDYFLVIHLMVAGRFRWTEPGAKVPARAGLAAFDFSTGTLILTEASKKKRASLRLVQGESALAELDPGGLEVLDVDLTTFSQRLQAANHTLKRALTDQRVFAGIGNAYSDEILLSAGLSPFKLSRSLSEDQLERLYRACREVLTLWTVRLSAQAGDKFPNKVTAFHPQMAVHGKYRQPCPNCGAPVQRIVYAENEANYCAHCQTGGRLLADRSLSRLLKDNWPKRLEDLE